MRGPTGVKFCTMVSTRPNFIMPVRNFGAHTPKKFQGTKTCKIWPILDDFKVQRRISPERMKIFKIGELLVRQQFLPLKQNKSGEDRSSNLGDLDVSLYPPKAHFSEEHISAPRGCCAPKFLHALENHQVLLAHPHRGRRPPLQLFSKGGQKLP